jgi:hypothetical protein
MSNKETIEQNNLLLQENNDKIQNAIDIAISLPDAGGGSGDLQYVHVHRDAVEGYTPDIEFIPADTGYTFELVDGYYQNTNQNVDSSTAICTVNVICTAESKIRFICNQDSENGYDYGTIITSTGTTILDCKNVSGDKELIYTCGIGTTSFTVRYSKDSSATSGTDTFKFKIEPIKVSYPEVDYDAYITNTDDFEQFITTENFPVNTTVVTYNNRGLSGIGYTKQDDGTWLQVGVYHDENSIPENIVRGKVVNGITGSYIDLTNYGNLSLDR